MDILLFFLHAGIVATSYHSGRAILCATCHQYFSYCACVLTCSHHFDGWIMVYYKTRFKKILESVILFLLFLAVPVWCAVISGGGTRFVNSSVYCIDILIHQLDDYRLEKNFYWQRSCADWQLLPNCWDFSFPYHSRIFDYCCCENKRSGVKCWQKR